MPTAGRSQTIATVERAADVLTLFSEVRDRTLGVTEIATSLGLSKAAVHRILTSLRTRGYIEVDEESHRYGLGPASFALGLSYLARLDVRGAAAPELAALAATSQETSTLSVLAGDSRIYVDQVIAPREIVMSVPLGQRFPLHAGSSGKALLAFGADEQVERIVTAPLPAFTATTMTDVGALRAELAAIRARGYATSAGERQAGAASVAAPVFDHAGRPVAAISICGPAERLQGRLQDCGRLLLASAIRVSAKLGHRSDDGDEVDD